MSYSLAVDLTIPYTLYPTALPHTLAWALFVAAIAGAAFVSCVIARVRGLKSAILLFLPVFCVLLVLTIMLSVIYMLFRQKGASH